MEERTFEGIWWLPERPDHTVGGRLEYHRETGHRLALLGTLVDSSDPRSVAKLPVLFGSVAGNDITLFDAWRGKGNFTLGRRYTRQEYRPEVAVVGGHLPARSDFASDEWTVHFTQLPEWLQVGGFHIEAGAHGPDRTAEPLFTVTYTPVELPEIATARMKLSFGFETSYPIGVVRALNIREVPHVKMKFSTPLDLDTFRADALWQLQNFLTFATDRPNTVEALYVKLLGADTRLEVIYRSRFEAVAPGDPWTMLFTYPAVAERVALLLQRWFEVYEKLGPPLNAIFSVIYGNLRSVDTKFLNVAQAAESYHRRMFDPAEVNEAHRSRLARIMATAPSEDTDWLKGKLAFSGEPFLNERLIALFARLGEEFTRPMFANDEEMQNTARLIGRWRHKLTHMRATPKEIAANLIEIHVCTTQLLVSLKANLLLDLGFTLDEVVAAFKYNDEYNYGAHRKIVLS